MIDENAPFVGEFQTTVVGSSRMESLFVFVVFLIVVVSLQWRILDSPPYVEQASGVWVEANWLMENNFDWVRLGTKERHGENGGPRNYLCSVMPTLLGAAMSLLPTPLSSIVAYRIFSIICTAVILAVGFDLLVREVGRWTALLTAVAILTSPIFRVQTEMLGMDMPVAAASMLWWRDMDRRRFAWAAFWSVIAFSMKPSAFVLPLSAATYFSLATGAGAIAYRKLPGRLASFALINIGLFIGQLGLLIASGNLHGRMLPFADVGLWLESSPDLLILTAAALTLSIVLLSVLLQTPHGTVRSRIARIFAQEPLLWAGWGVVVLTMFASSLTYYESRHLLIAPPMVFVILTRVMSGLSWPKSAMTTLLSLVVVLDVVNSYGSLYPKLSSNAARGWGVPERSLEYQADHFSNVAAAQLVDRDCRNDAVIASEQFIYFLKLESLGFVKKGRDDGRERYQFIAQDEDILRIVEHQPASVVVMRVESQLGRWPFPAYALAEAGKDDEILYKDELEPPVVVYRRDFSKNGTPAARMRACLDLLFSNATDVDPAVRLAVVGSERLARVYIAAETNLAADGDAVKQRLRQRLNVVRDQWVKEAAKNPSDFFLARRVRIIEERLATLDAGQPLQSLPWSQRTIYDTWPQRICYFPAPAQVQADGKTEPMNPQSKGDSKSEGNSTP